MPNAFKFNCECGSVFMTQELLTSHKQKNACKPNQVYTLNVRVRPSRIKHTEKCEVCGGKGWITLGKIKGGARIGTRTRPCPQNCVPPQDEYESFVRNAWAQVGTGQPGPSPLAQHAHLQDSAGAYLSSEG